MDLCTCLCGVVRSFSGTITPSEAVLTMAATSWSELVSSDSQLIIVTGTSCTKDTPVASAVTTIRHSLVLHA